MKKNEILTKSHSAAFVKKRKGILFLFLSFACLLSCPFPTLAQNGKVTINKDDVSIENILKDIQKQTGMNYLFNHEELSTAPYVTVKIENGSIEEALEQCFSKTKLTFEVKDKVIIVRPKLEQYSEVLTQIVRGKIVDAETHAPLPFATIAITTTSPLMGATTNNDGIFRLDRVPIGRHNITASFVGYETRIIPELMITTGKEVVLNIQLKEKVSEMGEVVVKSYTKKDKPLNSMTTVSARTFSVEETQRYAGGFDDPARLASAFAGVSTTGDQSNNGIIVRGNAPKGLLMRTTLTMT